MTEPIRPTPSPRDGFQPVPGFNLRGRQRQSSNIQRALGALARRGDRGDAAIPRMFAASLAGAIVAAEEASAIRDAANPT
jgi:hypothetical protein